MKEILTKALCQPGASVASLPDRDTSKPAEAQGLFHKFDVTRTDGAVAQTEPAQAVYPPGLAEIIIEAAEIISAIDPARAPANIRWPIADELHGFSLMLSTASTPPSQTSGTIADAYQRDHEKAVKTADKWRELIPELSKASTPESVIDLLGHMIAGAGGFQEKQPPSQIAESVAIDRDEIVWPKSRDVGRMGDMTPARQSILRVGLDSDNDVFVNVWDRGERADGSDFQTASIEFCNGGFGGGQSPRTRAALINLMIAMEADTQTAPHKGWPWPREGGPEPKAAQAKGNA